jgi:hypothetical protein
MNYEIVMSGMHLVTVYLRAPQLLDGFNSCAVFKNLFILCVCSVNVDIQH